MKRAFLIIAALLSLWIAQPAFATEPQRCTTEWHSRYLPAMITTTDQNQVVTPTTTFAAGRSGVTVGFPLGKHFKSQRQKGERSLWDYDHDAKVTIFKGKRRIARDIDSSIPARFFRSPGIYRLHMTWGEYEMVTNPDYDPNDYENPWSRHEWIDGPTCLRTETLRFRVSKGKTPKISVSVNRGAGIYFKVVDPTPYKTRCELVRKGPIHIVVSSPYARKKVSLTDTCGRWKPEWFYASDWTMRQYTKYKPPRRSDRNSSYRYHRPEMSLIADTNPEERRVLKWRVFMGGKVLKKGRVLVTPPKRIWWESDSYVNYCINQGRRTWSSGGRLFCYDGGPTYSKR